jgi:hypothetical protein
MRFPKGAYFGASDPIGYQAYIFTLRRLTADNKWLIGIVSAILSVLMPWTYYRAARALGLKKQLALWVWVLIVWTPSLVMIYHFFMMETLLLFLEGAALWATARYVATGGRRTFLLSVLLWTAAALTKPTVLPLAAVCIGWSCWRRLPRLKEIALAAGLALVLLVPQAIRSEVALGFIAPFGNPWLTRIQHRAGTRTLELIFYTHPNPYFHFKADPSYDMEFTSPSCFVHPFSPFSQWTIRRGPVNSRAVVKINSEFGARGWENAYQSLHVSWTEWLEQWKENVVLFLFAPSFPELEGLASVDKWEAATRWMWAPLVIFILVCDVREIWRRKLHLLPIAVTVLTLFLALQNAVTFEGRYRKPLEPLLLLNLVWIVGASKDRHEAAPVALTTNAAAHS